MKLTQHTAFINKICKTTKDSALSKFAIELTVTMRLVPKVTIHVKDYTSTKMTMMYKMVNQL